MKSSHSSLSLVQRPSSRSRLHNAPRHKLLRQDQGSLLYLGSWLDTQSCQGQASWRQDDSHLLPCWGLTGIGPEAF